MMGKRSPQDKLFAADHVYLDFVGRDTLYGYLAQGSFDLLGPISSPEPQPRLRRRVRRSVMDARPTTNHHVTRTAPSRKNTSSRMDF